MKNSNGRIEDFEKNLENFRKEIKVQKRVTVKPIFNWLVKKRKSERSTIKIIPLSQLNDWLYTEEMVYHKKGTDHFFSIQGVKVENSVGTEVLGWNQPIIVQEAGGFLVILCQKRENTIKFLLQAKFEAGNINKIQLGPTIQATTSNLSQHHGGRKPLFSEYLDHPKTTLIYSAKHNEEGSRFWQKSNVNGLILLDPKEKIEINENFIWLTLAEIKKLMLYDNVVNPFVKTILCAI